MLKIRLMRIGAKKKPFYRVVAVDERAKRTGAYVELLGSYNPLTEPKDIKLKQDRIDYWIKQGAQPSVGFLRIIGKAPQRLPRKAKKAASTESSGPASPSSAEASEPKEKKEEQPSAISPQSADQKVEETQPAQEKTEEVPIEEPKEENAPVEDKSES